MERIPGIRHVTLITSRYLKILIAGHQFYVSRVAHGKSQWLDRMSRRLLFARVRLLVLAVSVLSAARGDAQGVRARDAAMLSPINKARSEISRSVVAQSNAVAEQ